MRIVIHGKSNEGKTLLSQVIEKKLFDMGIDYYAQTNNDTHGGRFDFIEITSNDDVVKKLIEAVK
jgi:hypothetical protein